MTFTVGADTAYALGLWGSGRDGRSDQGDILLDSDDERSEDVVFTWEEEVIEVLPPEEFGGSPTVSISVIQHNQTLRYIGVHEFIPGVGSVDGMIIGESTWEGFVGEGAFNNLSSYVWTFDVKDSDGEELSEEDLVNLRVSLDADNRVEESIDWYTSHESVERNGGLIFGTQGLLSLQFVVASIAAVASSFVFLSLVLTQRQKELAILQAIGASPNQIIRLVLFEILSIVMVSMALGVGLGVMLAMSFNGLFEVFGFVFQIFGGSSTIVSRSLVYPWFELSIVSAAVFAAVVLALLYTTKKALSADLASVLKGE